MTHSLLQMAEYRKKTQVQSFLSLFSGIQLLFALYYAFDISKGKIDKLQPTYGKASNITGFKYSVLSLFLNGLLYHCLGKSLKHENSGFPLHYIFLLININQLVSFIFYFLTTLSSFSFFTLLQLLISGATLVLAILLTFYCFSNKHTNLLSTLSQLDPAPKTTHEVLVGLMQKRRDWGIASTLFSAFLLILLFWSFFKCTFINRASGTKKFGAYLNYLSVGSFLLIVGSLGVHVLALKVSRWIICNCNLRLYYVSFLISVVVGLLIYIISCILAERALIFYYHVLVCSLGTIISSVGTLIISQEKTLKSLQNYIRDFEQHRNAQSNHDEHFNEL